MTLRRRCQRSWTSWRLKRLHRKILRLEKQEKLLLLSLDQVRLMHKVTNQRQLQLKNVLQELRESEMYRMQGLLPELPPSTLELDRYLEL